MSTRLKESSTMIRTPDRTLHVTWQYHCPKCTGAIAREYVSERVEFLPLRKRVQAYCPHCRCGVEVSFRAGPAGWEQSGDLEPLGAAACKAICERASLINGGDHAA